MPAVILSDAGNSDADKGTTMGFLLRTAFWLTIVILLLPSLPSQRSGSARHVDARETVSAVTAAVSDIRQFCVRQPETCTMGSQALASFGRQAEAGAKMLHEFLTQHLDNQADVAEKPGRTRAKPTQPTLSPANIAAPARGSPARKEAEAKRPA
jgi:Family of unknown function (DUF5330)